MNDEERAYYLQVHGFDPLNDKVAVKANDVEWQYEAWFEPVNDPELESAGVLVGAVVQVDARGRSKNRVVFRRGNSESSVECIHTAVCTISSLDFGELTREPNKVVELARSTERNELELPPEEHFASLKSFVAGLVELGFKGAILTTYFEQGKPSDPQQQPFGFNAFFQRQVINALNRVAREAAAALGRAVVLKLAEESAHVDPRWFVSRLEVLDDRLGIFHALFTDLDTFDQVRKLLVRTAGDDPEVLRELYLKAVKYSNTIGEVLDVFAGFVNRAVQRSLVERTDILESTKIKLASSPFDDVREVLAGRVRNPRAMAILAGDAEARVRAALAANPKCDPAVLARLASDPFEVVRKNVASNPQCPPPAVEVLANDPRFDVRVQAYCNPAFPGPLDEVIGSLPEEERIRMATRKETPAPVLSTLAKDPSTRVFVALATNAGLKGKVADEVARALNGRPDLLDLLLRSTTPMSPVLARHVAKFADARVRLALARRPDADPTLLSNLSTDDDVNVRREVARNPRTPPTTIVRMCADVDTKVRLGIVENPRVVQWIVRDLCFDPSPEVRTAATRRISLEGGSAPKRRGPSPPRPLMSDWRRAAQLLMEVVRSFEVDLRQALQRERRLAKSLSSLHSIQHA
ncbi:MAG: hypothetical protein Kow0069_37290 [Promethearchaeota archaeon]